MDNCSVHYQMINYIQSLIQNQHSGLLTFPMMTIANLSIKQNYFLEKYNYYIWNCYYSRLYSFIIGNVLSE